MKCGKCGGDTKVIDSRDDSTGREDWLIRAGERIFGWWTSDFRLRNRRCCACLECETTIEIVLSDLRDSYEDLRSQLSCTKAEIMKGKIDYLSQDELESLALNLAYRGGKQEIGLTLTEKTAKSLVGELLFRRKKQREAQNEGA